MQRAILNAAFDINFYCCLQKLPVDAEINAFDDILDAHTKKHGIPSKHRGIVRSMAFNIFSITKSSQSHASKILVALNKQDMESPFYQEMLHYHSEEIEEISKDIIEVEDEIDDARLHMKNISEKTAEELSLLYENKILMETFFSDLGEFEPDDAFFDQFNDAQKLEEMSQTDYNAVLRDIRANHVLGL